MNTTLYPAACRPANKPGLPGCLLDYRCDSRPLNRANPAQLSAARKVDAHDG